MAVQRIVIVALLLGSPMSKWLLESIGLAAVESFYTGSFLPMYFVIGHAGKSRSLEFEEMPG